MGLPEDQIREIQSAREMFQAVIDARDAERSKPARVGYPLLRYFEFAHLPPHLQEISKPIAEIAKAMAEALPECAETAAGLRKLLEAKDCFVRAKLP